ncbi:PREDICTED: putative F-box/LRR-repeat protein 23 [Nicotiana attenuata]|uniref:F-boxlrr-repeat protein 23 n=1 Tax=Nicotiana attenuata TaxID=49451 RepID=A0A314KZD3_NICAT|nr:PREDICTED: putative F-box/LRR-repeat protein 23 [Nicotiana attenuata]OIT34129.1 putative f-boxlrr-repeat protein 23 [Nicotiana attenuata]
MANEQENLEESSSSIVPPPPSPPWVELPREITMDILQRLGAMEIVESAQRVCSTWWKVCHDPAMWSVVDLKNEGDNFKMPWVLDKICRIAVDRSQGQLLKISIDNFGSIDMINYIAERSSQLRHLRVVKCYSNLVGGLAAAAKNFPLLEELHIYFTLITKDDIESVGRYCPLLKSFTLNATEYENLIFPPSQCNDQALAIAKSMPKLRHLAFLQNSLTNKGLQAILDGCLLLESLDLRCCCCVDLNGDLERCMQQIVDLKRPGDSTHDYEFHSENQRRPSSDEDDDIRYDYDYGLSLGDSREYDYDYDRL